MTSNARRISATIVDLVSPKRDALTEFMATTGCRISSTIEDLITPKRNTLTEFMLTTGRRISVTIMDLISAKRDILTEFMTTIGSRIFATIVILIKLYFNTICAPEFLVIRKLYAISAKLISLSLRIVNFNRNCDKCREYLKFLTKISNFGKIHFILERVKSLTF